MNGDRDPARRRVEQGEERPDAEDRRGTRLRRRRLLGRGFIVAVVVLLGLNVRAAVQGDDGGAVAAVGGSLTAGWHRLQRALPRAPDVRVYRAGPVRWLANRLKGEVRIGLQVGHLAAAAQPDELANLRYSTGANNEGLDEVDVNAAVVEALAARLRGRGAIVDVLPATVPPRYGADLVLAVHADANPDRARNGYKSAHFWPARNADEALLKLAVDRAVLNLTNLRDDDKNVSSNMFEYYAFDDRRFEHTVAPGTPALLVELGYLSNLNDRHLLTTPDTLAAALEVGVASYLRAVGRVPKAW